MNAPRLAIRTKNKKDNSLMGHGGSFVGFSALRLEGRRFESPSSRYVETMGKFFTRSCLQSFGMLTLTQYQRCNQEHF